jgi:hypothetical protein
MRDQKRSKVLRSVAESMNGGLSVEYTVIGTGPQFPTPVEHNASTASEALTRHGALERLCGHAVIQDASGREVSLGELRLAEAEEQETQRRALEGS